MEKKSLYAYFGLINPFHTVNIPGHPFYQLPLLDSIAEFLNIEKQFDIFSYLPDHIVEAEYENMKWPEIEPVEILKYLADTRIVHYYPTIDRIIHLIENKEYEKIILKARFRNLSTLSKKWNDALLFEHIILTALRSGYDPNDIVILDTDQSLPENFKNWSSSKGIIRLAPSIDFQPFTQSFANRLIDLYESDFEWKRKTNQIIYYGNIGSDSNSVYKSGHTKNPIVFDCLIHGSSLDHFDLTYSTIIAGKITEEIVDLSFKLKHCSTIDRTSRIHIFDEFCASKVCLNVSKDLYSEIGFIPARVYEALIFGCIPISYNMPNILPELSFSTVEQYLEILKYIIDLSHEDYIILYKKVINSLLEINKNTK